MLDRMNIPRRLGFAFVVLNVVAAAVMIACGVSPTWPTTGMPRSVRKRTVGAIAAPPSSVPATCSATRLTLMPPPIPMPWRSIFRTSPWQSPVPGR